MNLFKRKKLLLLLGGACIFAPVAQAAVPFDNFSGNHLKGDNWRGCYDEKCPLEQAIEVNSGVLTMTAGAAFASGNQKDQTLFSDIFLYNSDGINAISATVKPTLLDVQTSADEPQNMPGYGIGLAGDFYSFSGGTASASLVMLKNGATVTIQGQVNSFDSAEHLDLFTEPFTNVPALDQESTLRIEYDGDNEFTFWVNDESKTLIGPEKTGDIGADRNISLGVSANAPITVTDKSGSAYVSADFDNIRVKRGDSSEWTLYDDFSSPALDGGKWLGNGQSVREIRDGKLYLAVENHGAGYEKRSQIYVQPDKVTDYFQADVTMLSSSIIQGAGANGGVAVYGSFFNTMHDGSGYNSNEGEVYALNRIINDGSGNLVSKVTIGVCHDASCGNWETFINRQMNCTPQPDIPITLSIEKLENGLTMTCGADSFTYTFPDNLYDSGYSLRKLRSCVNAPNNDDYGYIKGYFDNVYLEKPDQNSPGQAGAILADGSPGETAGSFTGGVAVNGGEYSSSVTVSQDTALDITINANVDPSDQDKSGELIVLVGISDDNGQGWFVKPRIAGAPWQQWFGDPATLTPCIITNLLGESLEFKIFQGALSGFAGKDIQVYAAYRLENGKIIYTRQPVRIMVTE